MGIGKVREERQTAPTSLSLDGDGTVSYRCGGGGIIQFKTKHQRLDTQKKWKKAAERTRKKTKKSSEEKTGR